MTAIVDPIRDIPNRERSGTPALVVACVATFLSFLDIAAVNLAFPAMTADLASPQSTLIWVVSGYAVAFASLLAVAGRIADMVGHRHVLIAGIAGFAVASLACAVAPSAGWLIAARVAQGAAGAMILPSALGVVLTNRDPRKVSAAIGAWTATGALASALGPALGAVVVEWWGWRAVFTMNLPICAALVAAAVFALPTSKLRRGAAPDFLGVVLLSAGIGGVVAAVTHSSEWGVGSGRVIALTAAGMCCIGGAVWRSYHHPRPAVEVSLWKSSRFAVANAVSACFGFAVFAYLLAMPIFLIRMWGLTLLQASGCVGGLAAVAMVAAAVVGKHTTDGNASRIGVVGMTSIAIGFTVVAVEFDAERTWLGWTVVAAAVGIGIGLAVTALSVITAANVPTTSFASGIGLNTTSRQVGGAVGVAALGAVVAESASNSEFLSSFHLLFTILVGVLAIGALLTLLLPAATATATGSIEVSA